MPCGTPALRGIDWFSGGPVGWYVLLVYGVTVLLGLFVVVDSLRPKRRDRLAHVPEPRWIYVGFQAVFLVFALFGWVPPLPRWVAVIPVAMTPLALAEQVAYLLRVVFPKPQGTPDTPGSGAS